MGAFRSELARRGVDPARRRWLFVPYDQLSDAIGPLSREDPRELGIVIVECPAKAKRRPYHKQKLALVLSNLRHFALEQAARGVAVRHVVAPADYAGALRPLARELGTLRAMRPAERELRADLDALVAAGEIAIVPHEGWLTTDAEFEASQSGPPWRMDAFYRHVRRETGILMHGGRPLGGKFSFDTDNRKPWKGQPVAPVPPVFPGDPIKDEVLELVERDFGDHPGTLDAASLPATEADAAEAWRWAIELALPHFGPFEDAMSTRSTTLFHTRVSALVNLQRLLPRTLVEDAAAAQVPLASKEGFIRQLLGWREFVRHVHERTPELSLAPSHLGAARALPPAFWGRPSGLHCLDRVVADVWREGYSHHITRLMVLGNLATLLDVSPRELTDWFWVAYTDAYDWVVEPNVLGMATFAVGELMTTKPYVSGAAYIDRMSDFCDDCGFDPKRDCPVTRLYWAFLERQRDRLAGNRRMSLPLRAAARRSPDERRRDRESFEAVSATIGRGETLVAARSDGGEPDGGGSPSP